MSSESHPKEKIQIEQLEPIELGINQISSNNTIFRKESDEDKIYNMVILAHKAQHACHKERKSFSLCRGTKVGRQKDPSFCET
jgi:hypothetical protein